LKLGVTTLVLESEALTVCVVFISLFKRQWHMLA